MGGARAVSGRDDPLDPMSKVRIGGREDIPHFQGKEQRLCFAGTAVKRYPTPKLRETQVKMAGVARGH